MSYARTRRGVNFNGFASRLREKGPHWSAEVFNKLPGFIAPSGKAENGHQQPE
ncbi:type I restriction enzyme EcoKI subunit R [Escherichia coli]|nr:type I restriction enzyme EcoKI subunit R [Escherichia coli]